MVQKSQATAWDVKNPMNIGISTISTGERRIFEPPTVAPHVFFAAKKRWDDFCLKRTVHPSMALKMYVRMFFLVFFYLKVKIDGTDTKR